MKKYFPLLLIAVAVLVSIEYFSPPSDTAAPSRAAGSSNAAAPMSAGQNAIAEAYRSHASNTPVQAMGTVIHVLPDDSKGDRHQRFLLRLPSGQTLLVAHNIDIAPRIPGLADGDSVRFKGIYEYNDKGGVVHWTHHDPGGRHPGGWLKRNGSTYQ